jgi:basic membrane protein A
VKVQMIENINYADMEQALTNLASKNQLVIGVGGQTQAAVLKIAKRFPKTRFSIVGGNKGEDLPNVAGYDVKQAEIAFVACRRRDAEQERRGELCGRDGDSSIVNAGKEFGKGAAYINPKIKYFENYTGDFDDVAKAKEATLAAIAQGADVHYHILNLGLRGMEQAAKEKGTHIIGSYTDRCGTDPLYIAYSITGVGYQVEYAIDEAVKGSWKPGYKAFGLAMGPKASDMSICGATPAMKAKIEQIKKDIQSGKIQPGRLIAMPPLPPPRRPWLSSAAEPAGHGQALRRPAGPRRCLAEPGGRRDPLPAGRERRGQVHPVQPDLRRGPPGPGRDALGGEAYQPAGPAQALALGVAMVHQHFSLVPDLSVVDNLLLGRPGHPGPAGLRAAHRRAVGALRPGARPLGPHRGSVGRRAAAGRDRQVPDARAAPAGAG